MLIQVKLKKKLNANLKLSRIEIIKTHIHICACFSHIQIVDPKEKPLFGKVCNVGGTCIQLVDIKALSIDMAANH